MTSRPPVHFTYREGKRKKQQRDKRCVSRRASQYAQRRDIGCALTPAGASRPGEGWGGEGRGGERLGAVCSCCCCCCSTNCCKITSRPPLRAPWPTLTIFAAGPTGLAKFSRSPYPRPRPTATAATAAKGPPRLMVKSPATCMTTK